MRGESHRSTRRSPSARNPKAISRPRNAAGNSSDRLGGALAPREKVTLPKRQKPGSYRDPGYPFKLVKEIY